MNMPLKVVQSVHLEGVRSIEIQQGMYISQSSYNGTCNFILVIFKFDSYRPWNSQSSLIF